MTFNFAPWAIDGARTPASLARMAAYAGSAGRAGVIKPTDLRVVSLAVPGVGLRVTEGGGVLLNGYLSNPDEAYVVSNPAIHEVPSSQMPTAQPGVRYYLVCVVVGDPEFNQAGHPFMPSSPLDPVIALDYEYVRIVVLPCTASARRFEDLGLNYPGLALARLEVPANTTTITNAMIMDVRPLVQPGNQSTELLLGRQGSTVNLDTWNSPNSAWMNWVNEYRPWVAIPSWATHMKVITHIAGVGNTGAAVAEVRTVVDVPGGSYGGALETIDVDGASERITLMTVFELGVGGVQGSSAQLTVQARQLFNLPAWFFVDNRTQVAFDVRFSQGII